MPGTMDNVAQDVVRKAEQVWSTPNTAISGKSPATSPKTPKGVHREGPVANTYDPNYQTLAYVPNVFAVNQQAHTPKEADTHYENLSTNAIQNGGAVHGAGPKNVFNAPKPVEKLYENLPPDFYQPTPGPDPSVPTDDPNYQTLARLPNVFVHEHWLTTLWTVLSRIALLPYAFFESVEDTPTVVKPVVPPN